MRNIKARTLWIIVVVLFFIAVGLIFAVQYTSDVLNKVCLVSLVVIFILITVLIQVASYKSFGRVRDIKYPTKEYECKLDDIEAKLNSLGYKKTKKNYGASYLLIKDKHAYKVSIVKFPVAYFSNTEEDKNAKPNKELDECETFLGVEIFNQIDEDNLKKLTEFTIQTKNIYYTAFIKMENGNYKCLNYEKPKGSHEDCYNNILNDIEFEETQENKETN